MDSKLCMPIGYFTEVSYIYRPPTNITIIYMQTKLFSTLCTQEHLLQAWQDVKAKKAGGGIDGETLATFEINLQKNL